MPVPAPTSRQDAPPVAARPTPALAKPQPLRPRPRREATRADFRTPLEPGARKPNLLVTEVAGPQGEPVELAVSAYASDSSLENAESYYRAKLTGCQRIEQNGVVYLVPPGTKPGEPLRSGSRVALSPTPDGKAQVFLEEYSPR